MQYNLTQRIFAMATYVRKKSHTKCRRKFILLFPVVSVHSKTSMCDGWRTSFPTATLRCGMLYTRGNETLFNLPDVRVRFQLNSLYNKLLYLLLMNCYIRAALQAARIIKVTNLESHEILKMAWNMPKHVRQGTEY